MINQLRSKIRGNTRWLLRLTALTVGVVYAREAAVPKPIFKMTQGQGIEVCESYLRRLQVTEFLDNDPTKGKLSEPLFKNFTELKTKPLTTDEVLRLYNKLKSFEQYQDQSLLHKYYEKHKFDQGIKVQNQYFQDAISTLMNKHKKIPFVRYQAALDLDNDGNANDTVIKTTRDTVHIGVSLKIKGLFIVDENLQQVDEPKMKAVFADQEILQWPSVTQFPPLASSIDILSYNDQYYFEGFSQVEMFSGDSPSINRYLPVMIGVFTHKYGQTNKICEYQWVNGDIYQPIKYHKDTRRFFH